MKIWINRAGQNLGTFMLEEVQRGLDQGQFVPADLGWQEGMETWKPLSEFPGLRMPPPESPLPPPLVPVPAGAEPALSGAAEPRPAWERRQEVGAIRAYFLTIREVLFESGPTFSRFNPNGNLWEPTWFFLVTTAIQAVSTLGWELILPRNPAALEAQRQLNMSLPGLLLLLPLLLVCGVLITLIVNFALVGLYHLVLRLLGGANLPYRATYRVVTYSQAAQIFGVLPGLGTIVAIIMFLVAASTGLQRVHQTQYWKAVLALVVPYILCFGMLLLMFLSIISVLVPILMHTSHQLNP